MIIIFKYQFILHIVTETIMKLCEVIRVDYLAGSMIQVLKVVRVIVSVQIIQ